MKRTLSWIIVTLILAVMFHLATIYAYPYYVMGSRGAKNTIVHAPPVSALTRHVVRPCPDLLYSACGFDLSEKPLHVTAPIPEDTYWSISMFANNTDNFFVMNDRKLGSKEVDIVLVKKGESFTGKENSIVVESPSERGLILFRMLIKDETKVDELISVQKQASCRPLGEE